MTKALPFISSQPQALSSPEPAQQVALAPTSSVLAGQDGLSSSQLLAILHRRRKLMLFVGLAVTAFFWGKTLLETRLYEGYFEVLIESVNQRPDPQLPTEGDPATRSTLADSDFETFVRLMKSPVLLNTVKKDPSLDFDLDKLQVNWIKDTKIIEVRYTDPDPRRAQAVLSALSAAYLDYSRKREGVKLQEGLLFLEQQLPAIGSKVNTLETSLERFRQTYNFVDPERQGEQLVTQLNNNIDQLRLVGVEIAKEQARYQSLQKQIKLTPSNALNVVALSESTRYQNLLNEFLELDKTIALESARVQPSNPRLLALQKKRAYLKPLLNLQAQRIQGKPASGDSSGQLTPISLDLAKQLVNSANEINVLHRQLNALTDQRNELQRQFEQFPTLARRYEGLERELEVAQGNLKNFLKAREQFRLEAAQKTVPWELISPPSVGTLPVSPSLPRNFALGLVLGGIFGLGAAILRDKFDHVYHTPQEVKEELKAPLLATLPYNPAKAPESNLTLSESRSRSFAIGQQRYLEAFRSLYTNLRFLRADRPIRSLAIGSAISTEGKSTVAIELARTVVNMGQRVLLVDTDLRKPRLHQRLNLGNVIGLSNVLTGGAVLDQAIQKVDDGLSVLTAGQRPPDPVRLLASDHMTQLIHSLQSSDQYDLVIFDTPQLLGMADTTSFTQYLDGLVLVVSLGKVDRNAPRDVIQHLQFANVTLLGIVTNATSEKSSLPGGIYKESHYYYPAAYNLSSDTDEAVDEKQGPLVPLLQKMRSCMDGLKSL